MKHINTSAYEINFEFVQVTFVWFHEATLDVTAFVQRNMLLFHFIHCPNNI